MLAKKEEKHKAIQLRKAGKTYSEILSAVNVSKSTLSVWLRAVELSKQQKQRYTDKKYAAAKRGGEARRSMRLNTELQIHHAARKDVGSLSKRERWLIGVALYWGEGSKQKSHNVSQGVELINDDFRLVRFFLEWLDLIGISPHDLIFDVYIHESSRSRRVEVVEYWTRNLSLKRTSTVNVYYKKHRTTGFRRKQITDYFGSMRVRVRSSSGLNRRIRGWTMGLVENCRIV